MSQDYTPNKFLRKTPNELLKQYFERKSFLQDIPFSELAETEIETVAKALEGLLERDKRNIEAEFRKINDMACKAGVMVLIEEAGSPFHNLDFSDTFEQMNNHYERAFWVFLNHPDVFEIASELAYMDRIGGWKHRYVGKGLNPAVEEQDKQKLEMGVSEFYQRQGRGYHCIVENYLRENPERHCYFAYPEDYTTSDISYDENGSFRHSLRKPAFEVIFVYKPGNGLLEISARGKSDNIKKLQEIFCQTILGLGGLPEKENKRFELSKLKDKNFSFVTEPQDTVEHVAIRVLRLDLPGMGNRRMTFEVGPSNAGQPIHTLIEKALNKANIPLDKAIVAKAKLQFKFAPKDGKKGKTLTFEISVPDRCTLRDDPLDQIAKKYIEKWELVSG